MHQSKHPGARSRCRLAGLTCGGVQDFPCAVGLLIVECCIVDKEIGILDHPGGIGEALERPGVSGVDDLPSRARLTHHVAGSDLGLDTVTDDTDRFPALEPPEERTRGDAQCNRLFAVEPARPLILFQDIAKPRDAVERGKRADGIAVEGYNRTVFKGVTGDGKTPHMTADPLHKVDKLSDPGRAVDREGVGSSHERERLNKPEDAEKMVGVPVGDEDGVHGKSGPGTHHLLLGAFPAVEEQGVGAPPDQDGGGVALRRRKRSCCAEEVDVQGLAGYTNHFLNAARLRFASSSVRPSITTAPE